MKRFAAALLLALAACSPQPSETVRPALWEVSGPQGQRGWLFGTIHALPEPVNWRSAAVDKALSGSDRLVMEIGNANDPAALTRQFTAMIVSPGQAPIAERVPPALRPRLLALLKQYGMAREDYSRFETWGVALTLSRNAAGEAEGEFGLEQELMRAAGAKPVEELEGAAAQFAIFDGLPEADQRDLLSAVVEEADSQNEDRLGQAWASGDMKVLEAETRTGFLADPELHEALLTRRNKAWSAKVSASLKSGGRPFVAVGAAHMAGPDGLPALLAAGGYTVRRIQ